MAAPIVSGSLGSATSGSTFIPQGIIQSNSIGQQTPFNVSLDFVTGSFSGTAIVERSINGGTNWAAIVYPATSTAFTATSSQSLPFLESQQGAQYRVRVSAYTSGTLYYQFGQ